MNSYLTFDHPEFLEQVLHKAAPARRSARMAALRARRFSSVKPTDVAFSNPPVFRFAPSPNGRLHLDGALQPREVEIASALAAWR